MSVASGRGIGACFGSVCGGMMLVMGIMFIIIIPPPPSDSFFNIISTVLLYGGAIILVIGLLLVPGARKESARTQSILRIAAVRKEVTIHEISQETGLDPEYVRAILERYLMNGYLFGYIEGDLFVRDTAGRPRYRSGQMGLYGTD
jgi:hypothetical protein